MLTILKVILGMLALINSIMYPANLKQKLHMLYIIIHQDVVLAVKVSSFFSKQSNTELLQLYFF